MEKGMLVTVTETETQLSGQTGAQTSPLPAPCFNFTRNVYPQNLISCIYFYCTSQCESLKVTSANPGDIYSRDDVGAKLKKKHINILSPQVQ